DQRARETLVVHCRHGDEHLAVEVTSGGTLSRHLACKAHGHRLPDRFAFGNVSWRGKFTRRPAFRTVLRWVASVSDSRRIRSRLRCRLLAEVAYFAAACRRSAAKCSSSR